MVLLPEPTTCGTNARTHAQKSQLSTQACTAQSCRPQYQGHAAGDGAGGGGAPPSPTYSSALVSSFLRPERTPRAEVFNISARTLALDWLGLPSRMRAAAP